MNAKLKSFGVDWLTATTGSMEVYGRWRADCLTLLEVRGEKWLENGRSRRLGYVGWSSQQMFIGTRDDGHMVQVSGDTAREFGDILLGRGGRASRIDLQLTVDVGEEIAPTIERAFAEVKNVPQGRGVPIDVEMRVGRKGARSVTIGKRPSEFFARIYDKEQESKEERYKGCVRYEVEVKGAQAAHLQLALRVCYDKHEFIKAWVAGWFLTHGVRVPVEVSGKADLTPYRRPKPSIEAKRAWLSKYVSGTFGQVAAAIGGIEALNDIVPETEEGAVVVRDLMMLGNVFSG